MVYDTGDEMTRHPTRLYAEIVTKLSPEKAIGSATSIFVTHDRDWNRADNWFGRFRPSSGERIRLPLAVGETWELDLTRNQTLISFARRSAVWTGPRPGLDAVAATRHAGIGQR
jgi:hypothetical protein